MRRFQFSLETLLRLKENEKRMQEAHLARATGACVQVRRLLAQLAEEEGRLFNYLESFRGDPLMLLGASPYLQRLRGEALIMERELEKKEKLRQEAVQKYQKSLKVYKTFKRLKERGQTRHRKEARREEMKSIDEINTRLRETGLLDD